MKLAIAGCDETGRAYVRAVQKQKKTDVLLTGVLASAGVFDPDDSHWADSHWADVPRELTFASFEELLRVEADAVMVSATGKEQTRMAELALEAGRNVLIPYPAAMDAAEILPLMEKAETEGLKLLLCNVERYYGNVQDVKRHIERGTIGQIGMVEMNRTEPNTEDLNDLSKESVSRLLLLEVDTLFYWLGDVVQAYGYRRTASEADLAVLTLSLACGALACVCVFRGGERSRAYELSGSGGNLCFDGRNAISCAIHDGQHDKRPPTPYTFDPFSLSRSASRDPYALLLRDVAAGLPDINMDVVRERTARMFELVQTCENKEARL